MKFLFFSDVHFHNWKNHSTINKDGMNSRLQDTINAMNQIAYIAKEEKVDRIFFGGDLFHSRNPINVEVFNKAFDSIRELAKSSEWMYMLVGNHDQLNKTGDIFNIHALRSIEKLTIMNGPIWHSAMLPGDPKHQVMILPISYHSDTSFIKETIKFMVEGEKKVAARKHILLGHFGVNKGIVGSDHILIDKTLLSVEDLYPDFFDQVFLGHYHKQQSLADNVHYIGSTTPQDWGDEGDHRGCLIWDSITNEITIWELDSPRFLLDPEESEVEGNFINLTANFDANLQKKYYDLGAADVGFKPTDYDDKEPTETVALQSSHRELVNEYVNQCDTELDEEYLKELGAKILNLLESGEEEELCF
jgi:DNA repair exonuclease SbcCD nuclease subunit